MLKFIKFYIKKNRFYAVYLNDKFELVEKGHISINKLYPLDINKGTSRILNDEHESDNKFFY
tara:strand:+ start:255 stop:440 length:186 start_codon:yes stop_codon:yes gene_type:complete